MISVTNTFVKKALRSIVVAFFTFNSLLGQQLVPLVEVNSPSDELHPVIHPSGDLYFTRVFHDQNAKENEGAGSIWKSRRVSGKEYSPPAKVDEFSTPFFDLLVGFPNEQTAYVFHHQYEGRQGIFVYELKENTWQTDSALNIPGLRSLGPVFNARLSQNGEILLMSMQSFGSYGNEDLYVSKWEANTNTWSSPVNLGSYINSTHQELTPYFSEEENILFFSSNRPGEGSGFQLFYSVRLDDSFTQWSYPLPLSFLDKEGVTLSYMENPSDGNAFFTSTSSSEGYGDIFILSSEIKQEIYATVKANLEEINKILPSTNKVQDKTANPPYFSNVDSISVSEMAEMPMRFTFLERRQQWLSHMADQITDFSLFKISSTGEMVEADNMLATDTIAKAWVVHVPGFMPLTVDWGQPFSAERLIPVEPGMRMDLSVIQFQRGSYQLLDSTSLGYIKSFAAFLITSPDIKIGLEGHTDNLGNVELNKTLSTQRASQIRDLLVHYGVDYERIRVSGFGGTRPIADNKTDAGRILNRRVEVVILEH